METSPSPEPTVTLSTHLYRQLYHSLNALLPPPLDASPEALNTRNHAAIAKVAALLPVNANEADLAAQCVAARAQAEDVLRLLREHTDDMALTMRLNAQYTLMVRTSLSVHGRLMKVQALRHKRDATEADANQDAWTQHIAERSMLEVLEANAKSREAASPEPAETTSPNAAQPTSPEPAPPPSPNAAPIATWPAVPERAPATRADQASMQNVPENATNSHEAANETSLSEQPWTLGSTGPDDTAMPMASEAMAQWRLASADSPASHLESPLTSLQR